MNRFNFLIAILMAFSINTSAQNLYPDLDDQSNGITNGYGSWGANNYTREASVDYASKGTVTFYHPNVAVAQKPTIFFINGWGRDVYTYDKILKYIASLGYPVVDIYNLDPGNIQTSYANSLFMIQEARSLYSAWIDTTKVGLMGHSYGAGSSIWLGNEVFGDLNWGADGRFIMMLAPWFSLLVDDATLQSYPSDVKLLVLQSYDDFATSGSTYNTDPRATRAFYQLINIPEGDKDFVTIQSDADPAHTYDFEYNGTTSTYSYEANHYICYTGSYSDGYRPYDALDVYSTNRLIHAMTDLVFENNPAAADVALGNGSAAQKDMGILPDLDVTDTYVTVRPENDFNYKCSVGWNDFEDGTQVWYLDNYCDDINNDGVIDNLPLPLTLVDFSVKGRMDKNVLSWITANEVNVEGFEVHRSFDGLSFDKISFVPSKNMEQATYSYQDMRSENFTPTIYYRLKMNDLDGMYTWSDIRSTTTDSHNSWKIRQNPISSDLTIDFLLTQNSNTTIQLINLVGVQVMSSEHSIMGKESIVLDISHLPKGTFILQVKMGSEYQQELLIKN